MITQNTASASKYPATPGGVEVRIPSAGYYFRRFWKSNMLTQSLGLIITTIGLGLLQFWMRGPNSHWLLLSGEFLVFSVIIMSIFSWYQARKAAKRAPLLDFSRVDAAYAWQYLDLAAPYYEVFDTCKQLVKELTQGDPERVLAEDGERGVIIAEVALSRRRGIGEVNLKLERFWGQDAETPYETTRVQILSRNLVGFWQPDPKVVQGLIQALKDRYPFITEGP